MKTVSVRYFSVLGEKRGCQTARVQTTARTAKELFDELQRRQALVFTTNIVKAAVNDAFVAWDAEIGDGDTVAFLPPFSGG